MLASGAVKPAPAVPEPPDVGARLDPRWRDAAPRAWSGPWREQRFALDGGATRVVAIGEGPPLLLLPPLPGYKEAWLRVAPRLAARHRVVTWDLRMRGPGAGDWRTHLADLERVADAHAPGRALVVGHSLGGMLALQWALARPDRVGGLVLSSTFPRVRFGWEQVPQRWLAQPVVLAAQRWLPDAWSRAAARAFARRGAWVYDPCCDADVVELVRFGIRRFRLGDARTALGLAFAHDVAPRLGALRAPTLVVVGERETPWARRAAAELAAAIPGARATVLPGVAHLHPLSAPEVLGSAIEKWCDAGAEPRGSG